MYSSLQSGKWNVGIPWHRYKDKLESNREAAGVPLKTFSIDSSVSKKKKRRRKAFAVKMQLNF